MGDSKPHNVDDADALPLSNPDDADVASSSDAPPLGSTSAVSQLLDVVKELRAARDSLGPRPSAATLVAATSEIAAICSELEAQVEALALATQPASSSPAAAAAALSVGALAATDAAGLRAFKEGVLRARADARLLPHLAVVDLARKLREYDDFIAHAEAVLARKAVPDGRAPLRPPAGEGATAAASPSASSVGTPAEAGIGATASGGLGIDWSRSLAAGAGTLCLLPPGYLALSLPRAFSTVEPLPPGIAPPDSLGPVLLPSGLSGSKAAAVSGLAAVAEYSTLSAAAVNGSAATPSSAAGRPASSSNPPAPASAAIKPSAARPLPAALSLPVPSAAAVAAAAAAQYSPGSYRASRIASAPAAPSPPAVEHQQQQQQEQQLTAMVPSRIAALAAGTDDTGVLQAVPIDPKLIALLKEAALTCPDNLDLSAHTFAAPLQYIPESLGQVGLKLRELSVANNNLVVLPDSLGELRGLTSLDCSCNHLLELPRSIGQLTALRELFAHHNKLEELPVTIGDCGELEELTLEFNQLPGLPKSIGQLRKLQRLTLHLNRIERLPHTIGQLESLRELDLHHNSIQALPESLGRLSSLVKLNVSGNHFDLKELPSSIGELSVLEELDVSENHIKVLPPSFAQLTGLKKLKLEGNPWRSPPLAVAALGLQAVMQYMLDQAGQQAAAGGGGGAGHGQGSGKGGGLGGGGGLLRGLFMKRGKPGDGSVDEWKRQSSTWGG